MKDAVSFRTRKTSIYDKKSNSPFKISRSKFFNFMSCKRCFYLDRVKGLKEPSMPGWALNVAVDELLKKEFDQYREIGKPHPYMESVDRNLIPFKHEKLDEWRENFKGVQFHHKETNLIFTGAVDDLWLDTDSNEVVVVDYKATSKNSEVTIDAEWQQGYRRQMDFYQWLLRKNGLEVSDVGYFVYCNGDKSRKKFSNMISFKVSILEYVGNDDWVEDTILDIKKTLDNNNIPSVNSQCKSCSYITSYQEVVN